MKKLLLLSLIINFIHYSFSQGNTCATATNLGNLPTPVGCGGPNGTGLGSTITTNGTNVGATAANPYTYILDCGNGTQDMAAPAIDVWYSFVATGTVLNVSMSGTLASPNFGLYTGNCNNLAGIGCALGANNGSLTAVFEPLTPGTTYYIQISGNTSTATGNFSLTLNNNLDCNDCLQASNLTVNPLPVNGTYGAGQTVTFCYQVTSYTQVSSNWLHGVQLTFGSGWDPATLVATPPPSCSGSGTWAYYPNGIGTVNGVSWGAGFYYDYNSGAAGPQNNYGDYNAQNCDPNFCWTITTDAACTPGASLEVTVNTSGDGESGSWTSIACQDDAATTFQAQSACCNPPTLSSTAVSCLGGTNGTVTSTIVGGSSPWDYIWYNASGTQISNVQNSASTTNTVANLPVGTYTVVITDNNGCTTSNSVTVTQSPGVVAIAPANINVCAGATINASNFTSNPGGATFAWTNSNVAIGIGASGSGNIPSFTATNNTNAPISATITLTPTLSGCAGTPANYTITVTPGPTVSISGNQNICPGASVVLTGNFNPPPTTTPTTFSNSTLVQIPNGNQGGGGPGIISVTSNGIGPNTIIPGQIVSICFTLKHEDFSELTDLIFTVNGVTFTSDNTPPAGQIYSPDLNTLLQSIINAVDNSATTFCLPQNLINLFSGNSNTTWSVGITDPVNGADKGDWLNITVILNNTTLVNYLWSPAGTLTGSTSGSTSTVPLTVTATPSTTTTYTLQVTNSVGCVGTASITITPSAPTASISGTQTICSGSTAALNLNFTGSAPWSVTYSVGGVPTTISGINVTPYTLNVSNPGTYALTNVTSGGCSGTTSGSAVVTVNSPIVISNVTSVCNGANYTVQFNVTGGNPATYSFSGNTGTFTLGQFTSNPIVSGNNYSFTVTDSFNCAPQSINGSVNCLCSVQASLSGGGTTCSGQPAPNLTFTLSGGTVSPYTLTYAINGVAQPAVTVSNGFPNSTLTLNNASSGNYSVVSISDGACTGTAVGNASILFNPLPTASVSGTNSICQGGSTPISFNFTGNGPWNFVYSMNGVNQSSILANSSPFVLTASAAGTYGLVSVVDANGCSGTVSGSAIVSVNTLPNATVSGGGTVCTGQSAPNVVFNLSNGTTSPYTLTYAINGVVQPAVSVNMGFPNSTYSINNPVAGNYSVVSINDASCNGNFSGNASVSFLPLSTASVTGSYSICQGDSATVLFNLIGASPWSLTYAVNGVNQPTVVTSSSPYTVNFDSTSTVSLVAVSDVNGCAGTVVGSSIIVVHSIPTAVVSGGGVYCAGQNVNNIEVSLTGNSPWQLSYSFNGGPIQSVSGNSSPVVLGNTPGTYSLVVVADAYCSDSIVGNQTITVNPNPSISLVAINPSACNQFDGGILVNGSGSGTVVWTGTANGNASITLNDTINNLSSGNYNVTFTEALTNCQSNTAAVTLVDPNAPLLDSIPNTVVCDSLILPQITGINLSGNQAFYTNSQANGGGQILGPVTSTQTVWVYDSQAGCSDEISFNVVVNNTPNITSPGSFVACDSLQLPIIQGTNLTNAVNYYNNPPSIGGTVINTSINSSQSIWIYDAEGNCADSTSFLVTIHPSPILLISNPAAVCEPGTIDITSPSVTQGSLFADSLFYWTNSTATTVLNNPSSISVSGTYFISAINNGCSEIASVGVNINPLPLAPTAFSDTTYCSVWTIQPVMASGGQGQFTWYDSSGTVLGTGSSYTPENLLGTSVYFVTETSAGCEGPASPLSITINECNITVPTAFTPDGDLTNETWHLVDLDEVYPNNIVSIFNRWGKLLYKNDASVDGPYSSNEWKGEYNGEPLPVATYYFIIELGADFEPLSGTVSILKKP